MSYMFSGKWADLYMEEMKLGKRLILEQVEAKLR
jgi:hypothetical protein